MGASPYIEVRYYCKSKTFLYPILGYRMEETYNPKTFLLFHHHDITNGELMVLYEHREGDVLFENFENMRIIDHPLLRACYTVSSGTVYIFDLSGHIDDIQHFLCGEYSKFTRSLKRTILKYFGDDEEPTVRENRFIHAVLFPEGYRPLVAKDFKEPLKDLPAELAPIYDIEKETLNIDEYVACNTLKPTIPI